MRFGSGVAFGADKPTWAFLLRHAGWQISRYKRKGNGVTAFKEACGEHFSHEVVLFAEVILARIPKPTRRALQGGKRWHMGDAFCIKGVWVGRSETSDEHIVLTLGGRVLSRTIRGLEPTRRHDARFLSTVKGLPWDAQDGIVRSRPRKEPTPPHPILVGESTQEHSTGMHDTTDELRGRHSACSQSGSGKETDDSNDVPMNESPCSDGPTSMFWWLTRSKQWQSEVKRQLMPMECDNV